MRKSITLLILASICIFAACKNDKEQPTNRKGYQTYSSDSLGFSMEYPDEFEPKYYIKPGIPIAFYEVNEDSSNYLFHPNVLFFFEEIPAVQITTAQYAQATGTQFKLMMQDKIPDFKIYDFDSTQVGDQQFVSYKFETPKDDSTSFTSKAYVTLLEGRAMRINCTSPNNTFASREAIFDKMIESITIKKK